MIYLYTTNSQTIATNEPISFASAGLRKSYAATQSTETTIQLNCPGIYKVSFNGTASATGIVQLYLNGEAVPGALANGVSLAFTTLVKVNQNCCVITDNLPARIQVKNNDDSELTLTNVALTIVKVG